jgi:hypothetical protein
MLAAYVSGHGWGHATRTAEVLRVVRERAPDLRITVVTEAPAFLFERVIVPPLAIRAVRGDVGLCQKDALEIDEPATVVAWREFVATWEQRVAAEARWLRETGVGCVLGDIPPLAFAAARAAGVAAIALGNFSWDWIYAHLAARQAAFADAAVWAREAYRSAALLLRLPFAGDLSVFPRIEDVPLVVRRPRIGKGEARRRLRLDARPAVLLAFGGIGLPGLRLEAFGVLGREYQVLLAGWPRAAAETLGSQVRLLGPAELDAQGLAFPDLVGAVDVVVTKPGYGIVSDCIGAGTRLVYTERGDFPEYPIMVSEMPSYLPAVHVSNEELREGRIAAPVARVLATPFPAPPRTDGSTVAAARILARI